MSAKPIIHGGFSLKFKSTLVIKQNLTAAEDLEDTLIANNGKTAGLAANMTGVQKRIIALFVDPPPAMMFNPITVKKVDKYLAHGGYLSLEEGHPTEGHKRIIVKYQNENSEIRQQAFSDLVVKAIQYEVDHCSEVLI